MKSRSRSSNTTRIRTGCSLGVKQLKEDPWSKVPERFPVGATVTGKVVSITDYGVFVELEEGVEGVVHVSEMSWSKKPRHPSKIVAVSDMIEIKVLKVEAETKRISLGMKQLQPNPWDVVEDSTRWARSSRARSRTLRTSEYSSASRTELMA